MRESKVMKMIRQKKDSSCKQLSATLREGTHEYNQ